MLPRVQHGVQPVLALGFTEGRLMVQDRRASRVAFTVYAQENALASSLRHADCGSALSNIFSMGRLECTVGESVRSDE